MALRQQERAGRPTRREDAGAGPGTPKKRAAAPEKARPGPTARLPAAQAFNPLRQVMWRRPGFLVRRLHQIGDALFFVACQSKNITPVQYGVLTALSMSPWLDQKAVGRELALDRTTTAEVLKRLEEKGLIERQVNPDDRRSRLSVITKLGLKTMRTLHDSMQHSQDQLIAPLSDEDRATFMRLCTQIVEAHENMDSVA
jgi:DNA-binding MarR family transcriptional regulator